MSDSESDLEVELNKIFLDSIENQQQFTKLQLEGINRKLEYLKSVMDVAELRLHITGLKLDFLEEQINKKAKASDGAGEGSTGMKECQGDSQSVQSLTDKDDTKSDGSDDGSGETDGDESKSVKTDQEVTELDQ